MRSSDIWKELGAELLGLDRSQMRQFGHLLGIPLGRLPAVVSQVCSSGQRSRGRDYIPLLAWEHLRVSPC